MIDHIVVGSTEAISLADRGLLTMKSNNMIVDKAQVFATGGYLFHLNYEYRCYIRFLISIEFWRCR